MDIFETIKLDPNNAGMGTGPQDIITPAVNNVFAKTEGLSILNSLKGTNEPVATEPKEGEVKAIDAPEKIVAPGKSNTDLSILDIMDPTAQTDQGDEQTEEGTESKAGRPKMSKDSMVNYLAEKIKEGTFEVYDDYDDKTPIEDYLAALPEKDRQKLLDTNIKATREKEKDELKKEVFESLPGSLQYIADAIAKGATEEDLPNLYAALLRVEQVRQLDINDENDQEVIAYTYLQATNFGNQQQIQEQVNEWKTDGKLEAKAKQFKPNLDQMQEQQVQYQMQQVEEQRKQQEEIQRYYVQNVIDALKPGDLHGIKLDRKKQAEYFDRLTKTFPSPLSGKPVNSLGAALERIQFSDEPDYKLLIHADMLLNDPKGYWEMIKQMGRNEANIETERKLKSAQASRTQSTTYEEPETPQIKKKGLVRQKNPFER